MKTFIIVFAALLASATAAAQDRCPASCPAAVEIPSRELVAAFRSCGCPAVADAYESMLSPAPTVAAAPQATPAAPSVAATPPPVTPPTVASQAAADPVAAALLERIHTLEGELGTLRAQHAASPATTPTVTNAPQGPLGTDGPLAGPGIPRNSESAMALLPRAARFITGYLHRRPAGWSHLEGLSLWNGLKRDADNDGHPEFTFAVAVRVDGRPVIPVVPSESGAEPWVPLCGPALDERGAPTHVCLLPPRRMAHFMVGPGRHTVELELYDATPGRVPTRVVNRSGGIVGGVFTHDPARGSIHSIQNWEVDPDGVVFSTL